MGEEREVRELPALGAVEIDEVQLQSALAHVTERELARVQRSSHVAAIRDAAAADVDGRDDHHGRRRASADVRG